MTDFILDTCTDHFTVLDPYQTFHPHSAGNWMNPICQKSLITALVWWSCSTVS